MDTLQLLKKLVSNEKYIFLNYRNEWEQRIPVTDDPKRWCHQVHFVLDNELGKFSLDDRGYLILKFGEYSEKKQLRGTEFQEYVDILNNLDTILEPEYNKAAADKKLLENWISDENN